jgi:hypothetical protein
MGGKNNQAAWDCSQSLELHTRIELNGRSHGGDVLNEMDHRSIRLRHLTLPACAGMRSASNTLSKAACCTARCCYITHGPCAACTTNTGFGALCPKLRMPEPCFPRFANRRTLASSWSRSLGSGELVLHLQPARREMSRFEDNPRKYQKRAPASRWKASIARRSARSQRTRLRNSAVPGSPRSPVCDSTVHMAQRPSKAAVRIHSPDPLKLGHALGGVDDQ